LDLSLFLCLSHTPIQPITHTDFHILRHWNTFTLLFRRTHLIQKESNETNPNTHSLNMIHSYKGLHSTQPAHTHTHTHTHTRTHTHPHKKNLIQPLHNITQSAQWKKHRSK